MPWKIAKMVGVTMLLLALIQYLLSLLTTMFVYIAIALGVKSADPAMLYSRLHGYAAILSVATIILLWIIGFRAIFKKKTTKPSQG